MRYGNHDTLEEDEPSNCGYIIYKYKDKNLLLINKSRSRWYNISTPKLINNKYNEERPTDLLEIGINSDGKYMLPR